MKRALLLSMAILVFVVGFAQTNFTLEKIDSVEKTKEQIYSDTKMFIAEYWKSAQNVIQNDDRDNGIILVKGSYIKYVPVLLTGITYTYTYTVKFFIKEGRYKILIDNVSCSTARADKGSPPCLEYNENGVFPGYGKTWLNKDSWTELMQSVKSNLTEIANSYVVYVNKPSETNGDW